jgi:hypothetical protein
MIVTPIFTALERNERTAGLSLSVSGQYLAGGGQ